MEKRILMYIICFLVLAGTTFALVNYTNMEYYVKDKVRGTNLQLMDFQDDLGLIDSLIHNEQLKRSINTFSADIGYGLPISNDEEPIYEFENFKFSGEAWFDDKSNVKYEITDFEVIGMDVTPYGSTFVEGDGILTYTATIKIERKIPVNILFDFYQDVEDKSNFENTIIIQSINSDELRLLKLEDTGKQTFKHNMKCYAGCE